MPLRPKRPCQHVGCSALTHGRYCGEHEASHAARRKDAQKQHDRQRGTAHQRGYTAEWAAYSRQYRKEHPLCVDCLARGILTSVERGGHVDHIRAVTGPDDVLFWEPSNHASRCQPCHSAKTAREDGGLGNKGGKVGKGCGMDGVPVDERHHWRQG